MYTRAALLLSLVAVAALLHVRAEDDNPVLAARKALGVYSFVSPDYPATFAIVAGISIILAIAVLFIVVGLLTMDPGRDSIIYRMTTTRIKKD